MKVRGFEVCKDFLDQDVRLPERSTKHSAGYDFFALEDTRIPSFYQQLLEKAVTKEPVKPTFVKTGVKAYMEEDEVLSLYNRSSKMGMVMANSVGIVDSDYYSNPDNDGHIMFAFYNFMPYTVTVKKGDKIGQGIFTAFLKADHDNAHGKRTGGFGSTGK